MCAVWPHAHLRMRGTRQMIDDGVGLGWFACVIADRDDNDDGFDDGLDGDDVKAICKQTFPKDESYKARARMLCANALRCTRSLASGAEQTRMVGSLAVGVSRFGADAGRSPVLTSRVLPRASFIRRMASAHSRTR